MPPQAQSGAAPAAVKPAGGSLPAFFLLTYALMWACFIPVAVAIPANTPAGHVLLLLGAFSPSIMAVWLTLRAQGAAGVKRLLSRVVQWRAPVRYYLFAAGFMAAIKLMVAVIYRASTGAWPRFGNESWYVIILAMIFSTPFQAGEEIGWRGYALPRLEIRFGLAGGSIFLGLIWACWHLPQFFIAAADTYRQSFPVYVLQVTAISVVMAWVWKQTNGSVLLTMLMHSAVNNSKDIVPSAMLGGTSTFGFKASPVAWLTVLLLWVCAAYFLHRISRVKSSVPQP